MDEVKDGRALIGSRYPHFGQVMGRDHWYLRWMLHKLILAGRCILLVLGFILWTALLHFVDCITRGSKEVTAIEFDGDGGYHMAVGSSGGKVMIYDLRSSSPVRVKDHMYGSPILNIKWHQTLNSERPKLITTDKHIVRIWDPETGEGMTSIEPTAGAINDMCVFGESGLMLLALDTSQIPSYFLPALGPAPKWCSYLENLTEEMEEDAQTTIYDDYKFLTKEELEKLNLKNLVGTNLLRAYMHGRRGLALFRTLHLNC